MSDFTSVPSHRIETSPSASPYAKIRVVSDVKCGCVRLPLGPITTMSPPLAGTHTNSVPRPPPKKPNASCMSRAAAFTATMRRPSGDHASCEYNADDFVSCCGAAFPSTATL